MHRTAYTLFLATLIFAPLAFGTAEDWSMAMVQLLVGCAALTLALSVNNKQIHLLKTPGILPLLLLVLWMFLQTLPLPAVIVQFIAPSIYDVYAPVNQVSGHDRWIPLTVNQKATLFECMRIATYSLFYLLTVQLLSNGQQLKKTVRIVTYLGIAIAFLAIIQKYSSPDKIYWFRGTPPKSGTVGPWVYHNHYAGFMEMLFPLTFALFLFYKPSVTNQKTLRSRIATLFTMPGSNLHFFLGFGAIIMISSIFVSLSRGGIISLSLALVFFLINIPRKMSKSRFVTYGILLSFTALMATWLGWEPVINKFGSAITDTGTIYNSRLALWQDSLSIIRDFWFTGTGFGTFINIYPIYSTIISNLIFDHAHNDYIELLTDGGIIGFALAAWFVLTIIIHGWKRLQNRRDRYAILLSIGSLTGIISILLHGVTDFNMHNGANGLYFFFLCGLLVSAGNTRLFYRTRPTLLDTASSSTRTMLLIATVLLVTTAVLVRGGAMFASTSYAAIAKTYLNKNLQKEKLLDVASTAEEASKFDPLEGKYPFALGSAQIFLNQQENALASFIKAAEKDPLSGIYLQRLALLLTTIDKNAAADLMPIAYQRALNKDNLLLTWAEWLLSTNERDRAVKMLQQVFSNNPKLAIKFMPSMTVYSFSRVEITTMLPESVRAWAYYGNFVEKLGHIDDAEYYMTRALDFLDQEEVIKPWYFGQLYKLYYKQKKYDKALLLLRQATQILPEHAEFHVLLGDYYAREGIKYRAKEEYEQALLIEPADEKTRVKLEQLQLIK